MSERHPDADPLPLPQAATVSFVDSPGKTARSLAGINVLQRAATFANFLVLPMLLPLDEMGALAAALAVSTVFAVIADMGIQVAVGRLLAEAVERDRAAGPLVGAALLLRTALGLVALTVGSSILLVIPFSSDVRLMGIIALVGLLSPLTTVYTAVLQTFLATRILAIVSLSAAVASTTLSLIVAARTESGVAVMVALFGTLTLFGPVFAFAGRLYVRLALADVREISKSILRTAWRLGLGAFLYNVYNRVDTILLSLTAAASQVALYYAAYRFAETIYIVTVLVVMSVFPLLSRLYFADRERATAFARQVIGWIATLGLMTAMVGPLVSHALMNGLYGARYQPAGMLMAILLLGTPFSALTYGITQTAVAFGNTALVMRAAVAGLIATALGASLLIPLFGAIGAAVATVITNSVSLMVILPWLLREFGLRATVVIQRGGLAGILALSCVLLSPHLTLQASLIAAPVAAACSLIPTRMRL